MNDKQKISKGFGQGEGENYNPWIRSRDIPGHLGTHHKLVDWKTGRVVHLLSNGEYYAYLIIRFNDNVTDVREQYPLDLEKTIYIAEMNKLKHPRKKGEYVTMTSDLLVSYKDGIQEVFSVKTSRKKLLNKESQIKNLWIEKKYWEDKGVKFNLIFTNEMNIKYAINISQVVYYYDKNTVNDSVSKLKYLIAHKKIKIDLKKDIISIEEYGELVKKYSKELETSL